MTPATFYCHFFSREQLLEELVQEFDHKWIDMVERLLAAADTRKRLIRSATKAVRRLAPGRDRVR